MSSSDHQRVAPLIDKAEILLDALPFIRRFSGKTLIIKYGGNAMVDARLEDGFAQDVVLLKYIGMNPVIVHGGGPQIAKMLERLGITSRFVRGMRVTDAPTMEVVEMVLVGSVNKQIVSLINGHGGKAVGLSGKDGRLIRARRMQLGGADAGEDIGMVGEVESINAGVIETLDRDGFIPVIAPVAYSDTGETLNVNADLAAAHVAAALRAEKFVLLTDVEGIRGADGEIIPTLDAADAERLIRDGVISGGMIPKVECCLTALAGGVGKTHIVDGRVRHALLLEIFTSEGIGSEVVHRALESTGSPA